MKTAALALTCALVLAACEEYNGATDQRDSPANTPSSPPGVPAPVTGGDGSATADPALPADGTAPGERINP